MAQHQLAAQVACSALPLRAAQRRLMQEVCSALRPQAQVVRASLALLLQRLLRRACSAPSRVEPALAQRPRACLELRLLVVAQPQRLHHSLVQLQPQVERPQALLCSVLPQVLLGRQVALLVPVYSVLQLPAQMLQACLVLLQVQLWVLLAPVSSVRVPLEQQRLVEPACSGRHPREQASRAVAPQALLKIVATLCLSVGAARAFGVVGLSVEAARARLGKLTPSSLTQRFARGLLRLCSISKHRQVLGWLRQAVSVCRCEPPS